MRRVYEDACESPSPRAKRLKCVKKYDDFIDIFGTNLTFSISWIGGLATWLGVF